MQKAEVRHGFLTTSAPFTAAAVFRGVSIALAIALHLAGSCFSDRFPLFPFTFPAAVLVQLCARRYDFEWAVNRRAVEGSVESQLALSSSARSAHCSLSAIGANVDSLLILAVAAIGWSVFVTAVIERRMFPQSWFEHSIPEFDESQCMFACVFVMPDMVDPSRQTEVVRGYTYRQIITPFSSPVAS